MTRRVLLVFGMVSALLLGVINFVYAQDAGPQSVAAPQAVMGTAFTYQGQLKSGGTAVSGSCEMAFRLYDAASAGSPIGSPITQTVTVNAGLFTTQLDFGASAFIGQGRWLETAVKCGGDTVFTPLSRQALTPAPYALALPGLRAEPNATSPNIIGGYSGNWITASVYGATIAGGGEANRLNRVTDNSGTVGGGYANQAGDNAGTISDRTNATVAGGANNLASGSSSTVGGGVNNEAANASATVGGGSYNLASGIQSTVPGGRSNTAAGSYSLAAGWRAKANADGCFVWGDATNADIACNTPNQFLVRATGGVSLTTSGAGLTVDGNVVWHTGNDGATSGLDADKVDGQHSQNFWQLGGNSVATDTVLGLTSNYALNIVVSNTRILRLEPNATSPNLIGGYSGNSVTVGVYGATIAGGGSSANPNQVSGSYSVVGGGVGNIADSDATVSGGSYNRATSSSSTVGGGNSNEASGTYATVGGGQDNTASAQYATVGGGHFNIATGWIATVLGGASNSARGELSTVIGGSGASATRHGELAFGGGYAQGQSSWFVLSQNTFGTVSETLYLDGDVTAGEVITFSGEASAVFEIMVVGRGLTKSGGYLIQGLIENWHGTTTLIGTPTVTVLGENDPTWNVGVLADNTLDGLIIWVQGSTGDTINWSASVHTIARNQP